MPIEAVERKNEITRDNFLSACWLNGTSIAALARRFECSRTLLYEAVGNPERYPNLYPRICKALPKRKAV